MSQKRGIVKDRKKGRKLKRRGKGNKRGVMSEGGSDVDIEDCFALLSIEDLEYDTFVKKRLLSEENKQPKIEHTRVNSNTIQQKKRVISPKPLVLPT